MIKEPAAADMLSDRRFIRRDMFSEKGKGQQFTAARAYRKMPLRGSMKQPAGGLFLAETKTLCRTRGRPYTGIRSAKQEQP